MATRVPSGRCLQYHGRKTQPLSASTTRLPRAPEGLPPPPQLSTFNACYQAPLGSPSAFPAPPPGHCARRPPAVTVLAGSGLWESLGVISPHLRSFRPQVTWDLSHWILHSPGVRRSPHRVPASWRQHMGGLVSAGTPHSHRCGGALHLGANPELHLLEEHSRPRKRNAAFPGSFLGPHLNHVPSPGEVLLCCGLLAS